MATAATFSKTEVDAFVDLLINHPKIKALEPTPFSGGPASKMSGAASVLQALSGPNQSAWMGPDGVPHTMPHSRLKRRKMLGRRDEFNPNTGRLEKSLHFSGNGNDNYLKMLHDMTNPRAGEVSDKRRQECREKLSEMGVCKIWQDGKEVRKTALAESSGITGGYTVPTLFAELIMTLAVESTTVDKLATKFPLTSRNLLVPSLDIVTANGAGVSNFLGGMQVAWTAEAALRSEFEPQFRQTELTAWELAALCIASNTLLEDQAVQLDQFLTMLFGLTVGWFTEFSYFQGNGVGKPLGMLNAGATIAVTREISGTVTYIDITNMFGQLWTMLQGESSVAWFFHPSVYPRILRMNDESSGTAGTNNQGRMLFVPINQGAQSGPDRPDGPTSVGTLFGHPAYQTEKLPALGTTGCILLADVSKYIVAPRLDIVVDVSEHYRFGNNQTVWRIGYRGDGQPWLEGPVTLADGVKTVSPFITLTQ